MKAMPERFRPEDERLALQLKALGHPARLAIVDMLAARGTCVCGEIVGVLPLAQATVSQHLKVLKEAGLVTERREGTKRLYSARPQGLAEVRRFLERYWSVHLDRLKDEAEGEERRKRG